MSETSMNENNEIQNKTKLNAYLFASNFKKENFYFHVMQILFGPRHGFLSLFPRIVKS